MPQKVRTIWCIQVHVHCILWLLIIFDHYTSCRGKNHNNYLVEHSDFSGSYITIVDLVLRLLLSWVTLRTPSPCSRRWRPWLKCSWRRVMQSSYWMTSGQVRGMGSIIKLHWRCIVATTDRYWKWIPVLLQFLSTALGIHVASRTCTCVQFLDLQCRQIISYRLQQTSVCVKSLFPSSAQDPPLFRWGWEGGVCEWEAGPLRQTGGPLLWSEGFPNSCQVLWATGELSKNSCRNLSFMSLASVDTT